jgi:hypothetical protein
MSAKNPAFGSLGANQFSDQHHIYISNSRAVWSNIVLKFKINPECRLREFSTVGKSSPKFSLLRIRGKMQIGAESYLGPQRADFQCPSPAPAEKYSPTTLPRARPEQK